ncbi:hypothetical protein [uncultured Sphingomonas sp.]|uniref:hypothetical protein n=1 Tax=uncultured Sphingomonas sp. TaxID=158754 RepID=UPI002596F2DC|nr:hypothetical protein [uncultured Sphingomonas sp.]
MIALLAAATLATAAAPPLHRYTNVKYGYSTCFPAGQFKPQGVSDAGDGQVFKAKDGAELRVWGRYASDDKPAAEFASDIADNAKDLAGKSGIVTYRADRPGWAVFSGTAGSQIFWSKEMLKGDRIVVVQLVYPASSRAAYRDFPAQLNRCSVIGTAPF